MGRSRSKWQQHLKAAQVSGMSLSGYAAQHGLRVQSLYDARSRAKLKSKAASKATAFVPVKLKPPLAVRLAPSIAERDAATALTVQARLGNGVVLSWRYEINNSRAVADLMHILAGLPCFA